MKTISIDAGKVHMALIPALAYQTQGRIIVIIDEKSPLVIIELVDAQAIDMKALDAASTALCGISWHRGQVGVVNGNLCLSFWKDDLKREFLTDTTEPPDPDSPETVGTYCETP